MRQASKLILCTSLCACSLPAVAMPVSEFLPKAEQLQNAGMGALFSKHRKPVVAEMKHVAKAYRADLAAAKSAGTKPPSCPPPKGKAKLNGKEFLAYLNSIPVTQQQMEVETAFHDFMKNKYPC